MEVVTQARPTDRELRLFRAEAGSHEHAGDELEGVPQVRRPRLADLLLVDLLDATRRPVEPLLRVRICLEALVGGQTSRLDDDRLDPVLRTSAPRQLRVQGAQRAQDGEGRPHAREPTRRAGVAGSSGFVAHASLPPAGSADLASTASRAWIERERATSDAARFSRSVAAPGAA
jgi:hypothetical protein